MYSLEVGSGVISTRSALIAMPLGHDLLLQHHDAVHEPLRPRRAARHVDVDRDDGVDALHHGVVVEHAAGRGAGAHRDAHLGCGICCQMRRMIGASLKGTRPAQISTSAWRGEKRHALHAEARQVEARGRRGHELDRAAGRAEGHRPQRVGAAPVHEEIEAGGDPALLPRRIVGHRLGVRPGVNPMQRSLLPHVDVAHDEDRHEHQHLAEPKNVTAPAGQAPADQRHRAGELPEVRRPRDHEHRLDVEDDEQHRDHVELDREALARGPRAASCPTRRR
jgi:hypothetical protein